MTKILKWFFVGMTFKALVSLSFYLENEAQRAWQQGPMTTHVWGFMPRIESSIVQALADGGLSFASSRLKWGGL